MKKLSGLFLTTLCTLLLLTNIVSAQLKTYNTPDGAYSVSYPTDFKLEYEKADSTVKLTNDGLILFISISRFPDTQETAPMLETGVEESIKETQKEGFKLIGLQDYNLNGYPGKRVRFTQKDKDQTIEVDYFYIAVKKSLYMIIVSTTQPLFEQNFDKVKPIIDSLQFKS